jgi:enoyl-[acyl-carrier protein] reductase I
MGRFTGKTGLILGVANEYSIAWSISKQLLDEGATLGFTHLPGDKMERRVRKTVPAGTSFLTPCDVSKDEDVADAFARAREALGPLDFVLHSIAYAPLEDLKRPVVEVSRDGFKLAMEISCYSLIRVAREAAGVMNPEGGSILTLTYYGGERVVPGYNLMGVCKSALDTAMKYLAFDLGPKKIRVNALSAGPVKTLAASAVGEHDKLAGLYELASPLERNVTPDEVGSAGVFLLSDAASGITGELMHVDSGYNVMGSPGRAIEKVKATFFSKIEAADPALAKKLQADNDIKWL